MEFYKDREDLAALEKDYEEDGMILLKGRVRKEKRNTKV